MKADHLEGLPEKKIHVRRRSMPEAQARVYSEVVTRAKSPESGPMLETLHLMRGVSLHPIWPPSGEIKDPQFFINQSARLIETFSILDDIKQKGEKALIFLESLELQATSRADDKGPLWPQTAAHADQWRHRWREETKARG